MSTKEEPWKCIYCGCTNYQDGEISTGYIGMTQDKDVYFQWGKRNSKKIFARACEQCGNVSLHVDI